ncbi:hypothetical protein K7E08_01980 [Ligilactobacillus salivarius]|uniref:hypothetical protein n=1 Tax=Ligilactobacillus salivarius TaxID=1624 RepID=UPI001CC08450|nr:hypothetical protein [Ligilactobacillus salivarius]MBZ4029739.1 hypothetical protein [Ligilactobacillus salivarius]HIS18164.1 hypothetical protein [Candidatus Coprovivens excrementavium]
MDAVKVVKEIKKRVNGVYISSDLIEYLQEVNAKYPGKLKPIAKGASFKGIQEDHKVINRLIQSISDNEKTFSFTRSYLFLNYLKYNIENLSEVKEISLSIELLENATSVELIQVKQGKHDITEHFNLEKDGSRFMINFGNEIIRKIVKENLPLSFKYKETISLEVPSFV